MQTIKSPAVFYAPSMLPMSRNPNSGIAKLPATTMTGLGNSRSSVPPPWQTAKFMWPHFRRKPSETMEYTGQLQAEIHRHSLSTALNIEASHSRISVAHRIDNEINPKAESFNRRFQRILAAIDIIPKILEIVVIGCDDPDLSILIHQAVEDRFALHHVRRNNVQSVDAIKHIEDVLIDRHAYQIAIRERQVQISLKRCKIAGAVEIVHQNKAAAIDELSQVIDFVIRERHLTRFRNDSKWIIEHFGTAKLDDAIRSVLHIDIRRLGNHLCKMTIGIRIIVGPTRAVEFASCGVFPARDHQFSWRRIVRKHERLAESLRVYHRRAGQRDQQEEQRESLDSS